MINVPSNAAETSAALKSLTPEQVKALLTWLETKASSEASIAHLFRRFLVDQVETPTPATAPAK